MIATPFRKLISCVTPSGRNPDFDWRTCRPHNPLPSPNDRTLIKPERHKRPKPSGLPIIHERAAGIDIGSRFHVVAVAADLCDEPRSFKPLPVIWFVWPIG